QTSTTASNMYLLYRVNRWWPTNIFRWGLSSMFVPFTKPHPGAKKASPVPVSVAVASSKRSMTTPTTDQTASKIITVRTPTAFWSASSLIFMPKLCGHYLKKNASNAFWKNWQSTSAKKPCTPWLSISPIWPLKNGPAEPMPPAMTWAGSAVGGIYKTDQPGRSITPARILRQKATSTLTGPYVKAKSQPKILSGASNEHTAITKPAGGLHGNRHRQGCAEPRVGVGPHHRRTPAHCHRDSRR